MVTMETEMLDLIGLDGFGYNFMKNNDRDF